MTHKKDDNVVVGDKIKYYDKSLQGLIAFDRELGTTELCKNIFDAAIDLLNHRYQGLLVVN